MKVWPEKLEQHLAGGLGHAYVVAGDEPLLRQEAADQVRNAARAAGFDERELHDVDARYDWSSLAVASGNLSLFATRRLLELRLSKPLGVEGGKAVKAFCDQAADDTLLLLIAPKIDGKATRTAWYKALEKGAAVIPIYPVDGDKLMDWVERRLRLKGLQPEPAAVRLLAEREEGNLLACVQDIEKLALLHDPGPITADQVAEAVSDNARFDVFALGDAALGGQMERVVRILATLRGEGVATVLVLWVLSKELRTLAAMQADMAGGKSLDQVLGDRRYQVWPKRRAMVADALRRVSPGRCRRLLEWAARIDGDIKSSAPSAPWDGLLALGVGLAARGRPPLRF